MWEGIGQLLKIFGMLLGWWKEKSDTKNKAKREVILRALEAADEGNQEKMKNAVNSFNSIG